MEAIESTTKPDKDKPYILEDKDYLLIRTLQELTNAIKMLSKKF